MVLSFKTPFIAGPGYFQINVAGDSHQQDTLAALCGPRRHERLHIKTRAQLVMQDEEPDVLVSIQGHQVGSLSRANVQALHRIVRYGERSSHEVFECVALISGLAGNYSVRLDLPLTDE